MDHRARRAVTVGVLALLVAAVIVAALTRWLLACAWRGKVASVCLDVPVDDSGSGKVASVGCSAPVDRELLTAYPNDPRADMDRL